MKDKASISQNRSQNAASGCRDLSNAISKILCCESTSRSFEVEKLDSSEVSECIQNGVPSDMRGYDFYRAWGKDSASEFLFIGHLNFPEHRYFCIVTAYAMNDRPYELLEWKPLANQPYTASYADMLFNALKCLERKVHLWIPWHAVRLLKSHALDDVDWNPDIWLRDFSGIDGLVFNAVSSNGSMDDGYDFIGWYQFSKVSKDAVMRYLSSQIKGGQASKKPEKSYFKHWQSLPGNSLEDITSQLAEQFDERVREKLGGSTFMHEFAEYVAENGLDTAFEDWSLDALVDRKAWWDLIPDQTYKAAVSRELASHEDRLSRGVSLKTLDQMLDKICRDLSILWLQSFKHDTILARSKFAQEMTAACIEEGCTTYTAAECVRTLFILCSSFVDKHTYKYELSPYADIYEAPWRWAINDSDTGAPYMRIMDLLDKLSWNEDDSTLIIATISQIVDVMHDRGCLAGVFIEGGAKTCDQVSSMKSGEIYESRS